MHLAGDLAGDLAIQLRQQQQQGTRLWWCGRLPATHPPTHPPTILSLLIMPCCYLFFPPLPPSFLPFLPPVQILGFPLDQIFKCLLATPVQFWVGWRFHRGAYVALRSGR